RLVVIRRPADTLRALTVFFDPDSSQIRLAADVVLRATVETLTVHLELRGGGFALFSGTRALEVRAGRPGAPQQIPVTYTGPGSTVTALTLTPRDTVLTFGDAVDGSVGLSNTGGNPQTGATVGSATGPENLAGRGVALPPERFSATAHAGAVSAATSVVTASAASVLSGAIATLTLRAKDAF